jgi:propanol-preferring alcohol dehydrogenase
VRRGARFTPSADHLCGTASFTGWDRDGGYATHALVRADFALRLPRSFDDLAAAPLLCGGVIGYRALKVSGVRPGQRLGLFGFGASALIALQIARHWGCRVFVCTRSASERERARASYDHLWWERSVRSVANFTRQDALELLDLAARIPIQTSYDVYPLREANRALQDLKAGRVAGAAVLNIA